MFWKRKKAAEAAPSAADLITARVTADDGVNGLDTAKTCKARGRYELALAFQRAGTAWYADNVVGKPVPGDTDERRARFDSFLAEYRVEIGNLERAAVDRDALLELLKAAPDGLTQAELSDRYTLSSTVKLGVMLNQLERGGWVVRQGEGKTAKVFPSTAVLTSDAEFMAGELNK